MHTLTAAVRAIRARLVHHSPLSPKGFGILRPSLPSLIYYPERFGLPFGLDATGQPVFVPRGESVLIAGDPRTSVTTALRTLALAHARHPGTRVHVYEPEFTELAALRPLAHRYITTEHGGATIGRVTEDLRSLAVEIRRRLDLITGLDSDYHGAEDRIHAATDDAGLHRHVVIIGDAIRWALSDDDGSGLVAALTEVAVRGANVGITVLVATPSPYLPYLPTGLTGAFPTRIAMQLRTKQHTDQVLGALARQSGITTDRLRPADDTPATGHGYGLGWVGHLGTGAEPTYQLAQVYDTNPDRFAKACRWLTDTRRRGGWLTGDALDHEARR